MLIMREVEDVRMETTATEKWAGNNKERIVDSIESPADNKATGMKYVLYRKYFLFFLEYEIFQHLKKEQIKRIRENVYIYVSDQQITMSVD